ncbi:response regulator [Microaerobacter geothermalis]|uniref:AAA family ATPase n=1 Tax=Microaerobacter geothermalis TaxID=674972 RepID=UPI001F17D591|nr:response regulator [Microaerobacter geothermalis]MCF6094187.1 response regulator [Microaerobacter geothermalis]
MQEYIRILIADDIAETRENIRRLLSFEEGVEVVGEAANGIEAVEMAKKLQPDIVLMDINMPEMDGIEATEKISLQVPKAGVIVVSVQGEQDYLKKAMRAGAKEYIIKPFSPDDLINTILQVVQMIKKYKNTVYTHQLMEEGVVSSPKVITVFGGSGGTGKTCLAVHTAIQLVKRNKKAVLLDLDLWFGDISNIMNLSPRQTLYHIINEVERMSGEELAALCLDHSSGLKVLPAPVKPEQAELITGRHVERIIRLIQEQFDFIVIDTPAQFSEVVLQAIDQTDTLLLLQTPHMTGLQNNKRVLEVLSSIHFDKKKIRLIVNRSDLPYGLKLKDIKEILNLDVFETLPEEPLLTSAINRGEPLISSNGKWSKKVEKLSKRIVAEGELRSGSKKKKWFSFV